MNTGAIVLRHVKIYEASDHVGSLKAVTMLISRALYLIVPEMVRSISAPMAAYFTPTTPV